jgi:serine/threonine-protein phosphatase PPG1
MSADLDKQLRVLAKGELLSEDVLKRLCEKLKDSFIQEPNVVPVAAPVTVVGNLHGQLYDLFETFRVGGAPPDTNYLFLGDYVSMGFFSVETMSLLICLKLRFPERVTLLRGRHETRRLSTVYGFYNEIIRKYGTPKVWNYFVDLFDYLPIAAVVEKSIFCVHSGISQHVDSIDQLRCLYRCQEIPLKGIVYEMLNSNPVLSKKESASVEKWKDPSVDVQLSFGADDLKKFMTNNDLGHVVRSNQLCIDGYQQIFSGKLSTIWGAPNFMNRCGNVASILEIADNLDRSFNTFHAAPNSERTQLSLEATKAVLDYYS